LGRPAVRVRRPYAELRYGRFLICPVAGPEAHTVDRMAQITPTTTVQTLPVPAPGERVRSTSVSCANRCSEWIVRNGMNPVSPQSPEELQRFVRSEIARLSKIIEQIGIARSQ
jgi:hypothetical protein